MTDINTAADSAPTRVLIDHCLEHLRREALCMEGINASLLRVRAALVAADPAALTEALELQHAAAVAMVGVQSDRQALRQQIANELSLALEDATIRRLAEQSPPPWNEALAVIRGQLRTLADQSRRLAEGNALLMHNWSHIIDRVLHRITGQAGPAERYDATGTKDSPPPTPLFHARC